MIGAKHAKQIRCGINIAKTHLHAKKFYERLAAKGDKIAERELILLLMARNDPKYLRTGSQKHPKLVKKAFDSYVRRNE